MTEIIDAIANQRLSEARTLVLEYQQQLGVDLCFQDFDQEIDNLEHFYAAPGRFFLATDQHDHAIGCVGYHPIETDPSVSQKHAEIKRLYVQPASRSGGLGRRLVELVMQCAKEEGFDRLCLDTLPQLEVAIGLYERLGFEETEPYCENPLPGVRWLAITL